MSNMVLKMPSRLSSSGQQASGETGEPVRLLKDNVAPTVRWLLPERYWPPGVKRVGDVEPEVPIALSPTEERQRLYLNASPVATNQTLRLSRGMLVFDRSGFSLLGAVSDDSGLRKSGEQKAGLLAVGDLGVTVTPQDPATEEPQRIELTNFVKADGKYTLRLTLEDRCGNKLENEAQALVTIDTRKPDDYLRLGLLPFQDQRSTSKQLTYVSGRQRSPMSHRPISFAFDTILWMTQRHTVSLHACRPNHSSCCCHVRPVRATS